MYVTRVIHSITTHISATMLAPYVLLRLSVTKIRLGIVIHATGLFSVKNHLTLKVKGKLVSKWRQACRNCNLFEMLDSKHE
jgi:hypothetical protein